VKFIERDKETALFITKSLSAFEKDSSRSEVFCADANEWIQKSEETFDIVFIDPPFNGDSIYKICHEVEETGLAKRLIYLEWHSEIDSSLLPKKWDLLKHKKSGSVFFALCLKD
jgi:16S rRNA (guanine966-N2)-methyltransferase